MKRASTWIRSFHDRQGPRAGCSRKRDTVEREKRLRRQAEGRALPSFVHFVHGRRGGGGQERTKPPPERGSSRIAPFVTSAFNRTHCHTVASRKHDVSKWRSRFIKFCYPSESIVPRRGGPGDHLAVPPTMKRFAPPAHYPAIMRVLRARCVGCDRLGVAEEEPRTTAIHSLPGALKARKTSSICGLVAAQAPYNSIKTCCCALHGETRG